VTEVVRQYDHILGEHWLLQSHGRTLGVFTGETGRDRAYERAAELAAQPSPLRRTLEARARMLRRLRRLDLTGAAAVAQARKTRRQ
jgi:hypothetical protein